MKPQMAFRVGVTGKRNLDAAVTDSVRARVRAVLETVKRAAQAEARSLKKCGAPYADEAPLLRAISPMAEGADRIFAEEALECGFQLECPLPFERNEYAKDFKDQAAFFELLDKAKAVFELDGSRDDAPAAYETAGRVVVDQCDLLIAVWDGLPAAGKGGTAEIIELARRRIPVVCLRIDGAIDGTKDTFMRPDRPLGDQAFASTLVEEYISAVLWPPQSAEANLLQSKDASPRAARGKDWLFGRLWRSFTKLFSWGPGLPESPWAEPPDSPFRALYQQFDAVANRLSGLYRGAFLTSYVLGVAAVFLALLGVPLGPRERPPGVQAPRSELRLETEQKLLIGELAVIAGMLTTVAMLRRRRWHYRSVDCRYVAEQFRLMGYLYPLGMTTPPPRLPAHHLHGEAQKSWMEWVLRAKIRSTTLIPGVVTKAVVDQQYQQVAINWIGGQVSYHERNHASLHRIESRLEKLIRGFALMAAGACLVHLFWRNDTASGWLTLAAAGFPAASAACHAISTQGEFRRLSRRSDAMSKRLKQTEGRLIAAKAAGTVTMADLRREAHEAAEIMVEEVVDWQVLYPSDVLES